MSDSKLNKFMIPDRNTFLKKSHRDDCRPNILADTPHQEVLERKLPDEVSAIPGQSKQINNDPFLKWEHSNLKQHLKGFIYPQFLRPLKDDAEVMNFIFTSLSFFINTTIKRPNPTYTWADLPVPDQLIDRVGSSTICIDGSVMGRIEIYR